MEEKQSFLYTLILGVCMLLSLLLIGKMLLGRPVEPETKTPPQSESEGEGEAFMELQLGEDDLSTLIRDSLPIVPEQLTVRIGADGKIEVSTAVSKQALSDCGFDAGNLRTAMLFLPDPCKLYGAWQVSVLDGALSLTTVRAEIAGLTLPEEAIEALTIPLTQAVNQKLKEWGMAVREVESTEGSLILRP